jgi:hypothetical protein
VRISLAEAAIALLVLAPSLLAGTLVEVAHVRGFPGATVAVPVLIAGNEAFTAAQFEVGFDPSRSTAQPVSLGSASTNHVIRSRVVAPGIQRTVLYSPTNARIAATNTSLLAVLAFALAAEERAGSGPLTPQGLVLSGPGGNLLSPVTAVAGSISFVPILINEAGQAQFFLSATSGTQYLVQASTNLLDWVDLYSAVAVGNYLDLTDDRAPLHTQRFYRAVPTAQSPSPPFAPSAGGANK